MNKTLINPSESTLQALKTNQNVTKLKNHRGNYKNLDLNDSENTCQNSRVLSLLVRKLENKRK